MKMDKPMVRAAVYSAILNAISNILGQLISCYQKNWPFDIDTVDLVHFVIFGVLINPPNYLWQQFLEENFPAYTNRSEKDANRSPSVNADYKEEKEAKQISVRNTAAKFLLDQTIGGAVNTILFIVGLGLIKGKPPELIVEDCKQKFWPLIFAGLKLWPAVSLASFVMVPVELRTTFGSIVGLFWGIYLSLLSSD